LRRVRVPEEVAFYRGLADLISFYLFCVLGLSYVAKRSN